MASLILQNAGAALGAGVAGPVGAFAGRAIGGALGGALDQRLFGEDEPSATRFGARLADLNVQGGAEGVAVPRVYGRARVVGQIIWAPRFAEERTSSTSRVGGGKGGGGRGARVTSVRYRYFADFAVGLCEGPIARIGRIWADGALLNPDLYAFRLYKGDESQSADHLIAAKEGFQDAPAYRGIAYVVFERMPLAPFGNRIPQLAFEVFRGGVAAERFVKAVSIIPASTEFGYDTNVVRRKDRPGVLVAENAHASDVDANWNVSLNQLQDTAPDVVAAALTVGWFADDLRCGRMRLKPAVTRRDKETIPYAWRVADVERADARVVSQYGSPSRPAYGGTPSDISVIRALRDLRDRGVKPMLHPFIFLDIPQENALENPYDSSNKQPAHPWRGRITSDPAVNCPPDVAEEQVAACFGRTELNDFELDQKNQRVLFRGDPDDWGLRRMILHYAHLCRIAGGVEAFLIGSEMVALNAIRGRGGTSPAVAAYKRLAADVKQVFAQGGLNPKVSYAADWSEYFGERTDDGDVRFPLDDLWGSDHIDFVGINAYMPLADWRDGNDHKDAVEFVARRGETPRVVASIRDVAYLADNIAGGEGFDWFYQSPEHRRRQIRTPINDGPDGETWLYRYKDVAGWWSSKHFERVNGRKRDQPTPWRPKSKPIRFTEIGCPAVDKGANEPNAFPDPKSSESRNPRFSDGARDDRMQRAFLEAIGRFWSEAGERNPANPLAEDQSPMVSPEHLYVWAWDARPWPMFPARGDVWGDAPAYRNGHWINGRLAVPSLADAAAQILEDADVTEFNAAELDDSLEGAIASGNASPRALLEALADAWFFDAVERDGRIVFRRRDRAENPIRIEATKDLVAAVNDDEAQGFQILREDENQTPYAARFSYLDAENDYQPAAAEARLADSNKGDVILSRSIPAAMTRRDADDRVEIMLDAARAAREELTLDLPLRRLDIEPGDQLLFVPDPNEDPKRFRVARITDGATRRIVAVASDPSAYRAARAEGGGENVVQPETFSPPDVRILNLPAIRADADPGASYVAAWARPWPRNGLVVLAYDDDGDHRLLAEIPAPAVMGRLDWRLWRGPVGRRDLGNQVAATVLDATLESVADAAFLGGANAAAVRNDQGRWEVLQFRDAEPKGKQTFVLSHMLRGQLGTEDALNGIAAPGAPFVLLNDDVVELPVSRDDVGRTMKLKIGPADADLEHHAHAFTVVDHEPSADGLRPFSPAHLKAKFVNGGVRISWIRRARVGGDAWDVRDPPLGEQRERYRIEIRRRNQPEDEIIRVFNPDATEILYSDEDIAMDWNGNIPNPIRVAAAQIGEFDRPGTRRVTDVPIR